MFISKKSPIQFRNSDILAPSMVNENNNYFRKAFEYEANKQTARWTSTYSLCPDLATSLTSASPAAFLTRRIPPNTFRAKGTTPNVIIESFAITIYYEATAEFSMSIGGGAETITFPIRDASLATEPYQVVRLMNITSTTDTLFTVTLPVGVTITKFDVTVGFASDRYLSGNDTVALTKPTLTLPEFNENSTCNAVTFSNMKTTIETAATNAKAGVPFRWVAFDFHNITSATNILLRSTVALQSYASPSFTSLAGSARVIGIWADINQSVVGSGSVAVFYFDPASTVLATAAASPAASQQIGSLTTTPASGVINSSADLVANDNQVTISLTTAGNTISRATVYLLLQ